MTFMNDAQFLDWLARVRAFNRQHAMHEPAVPATWPVLVINQHLKGIAVV